MPQSIRSNAGAWSTNCGPYCYGPSACVPAQAGARQAKPFKQFLLTFSAIYPLSVAVPAILRMLTKGWSLPTGLVQLCASALLVWLMVYVVMPRYVKAASSWLFR